MFTISEKRVRPKEKVNKQEEKNGEMEGRENKEVRAQRRGKVKGGARIIAKKIKRKEMYTNCAQIL